MGIADEKTRSGPGGLQRVRTSQPGEASLLWARPAAGVGAAHEQTLPGLAGKIAVDGLGSVSIINVLDVFSCLKIDSQPCLNTTHANTQDYQLVLLRAFVGYGLPEQISLVLKI